MQTVEHIRRIPAIEERQRFRWSRLLLQSTLAIGGILAVTFLLYGFHLYPRIPNISIVYLLVILALASIFGRYASLLASITASLSFDFFLVPPLYTFTMARWEEWVALFVFLVTALLTSQLTLNLRQQRNQSHMRESEFAILYDMIRLTNSRESPEDQLGIVLLSLAHVFSAWGVYACALLLPDGQGALRQLVDTSPEGESFSLSDDERMLAVQVMVQNQAQEKRYAPRPAGEDRINHIQFYRTFDAVNILRLIPLSSGSQVLGVLCLRIKYPVPWFVGVESLSESQGRADPNLAFFWTFLEQATSILERSRLRSELLPWKRP